MDFKRIFTRPKVCILVSTLALSFLSSSSFAAISANNIEALNKSYQKITHNFYSELAKNLTQCRGRSTSLKRLNLQLKKLATLNKNIIGVCLIQSHFPLIKTNIDSKEIFPLFQFLLDNNNITFANKIYAIAKNESDQSFISNLSFIYARYYIKRKKWNKVLQYINGTYNDLTIEDANLARLLTGIALQKTKQHRKAVKIYAKIPSKSKYYPAARLNIATAYIRQDWWTDAHIKIDEILDNKKIKTHNEMINRLYLVLGYSLLRKEFHRDSREAFRNIEIDSIYFNKALLGITLTAANQEDYVGALNAVNILKENKTIDLSVEESHLLQPYIYEKLNQNLTASASYTAAQKYYKNRIESILKIKESYTISAKSILKSNNKLIIEHNVINLTNHFPIDVLKNSAQLEQMSEYKDFILNKTTKRFNSVQRKHNAILKNIIDSVFDNRISYLKRYMNQSRYGLARLFDHSNKVN